MMLLGGQPGLSSKFRVSQGYVMRAPSQKKKPKQPHPKQKQKTIRRQRHKLSEFSLWNMVAQVLW